jgi:hypothetical protein
MKQHTPDAVLRPGAEGWELWKFPLKESPSLDQAFSEKSLDAFANLTLCLRAVSSPCHCGWLRKAIPRSWPNWN